MSIQEDLASTASMQEKAKIVWNHYQHRTLSGPLEPKWVHAGYELVDKLAAGEPLDEDEVILAEEIIHSHSLADGYAVPAFAHRPGSPQRIMHDGWKAGTATWIFMGRSLTEDSTVHLGAGWVAVQRTLPDDVYKLLDQTAPATLWMAYNLDQQMGVSALTSNVIGPATSFNQLWDAVDTEAGPLYRTGANDKYA